MGSFAPAYLTAEAFETAAKLSGDAGGKPSGAAFAFGTVLSHGAALLGKPPGGSTCGTLSALLFAVVMSGNGLCTGKPCNGGDLACPSEASTLSVGCFILQGGAATVIAGFAGGPPFETSSLGACQGAAPFTGGALFCVSSTLCVSEVAGPVAPGGKPGGGPGGLRTSVGAVAVSIGVAFEKPGAPPNLLFATSNGMLPGTAGTLALGAPSSDPNEKVSN